MALTINRKILSEILSGALVTGLITPETSSTMALYQVSRYWREAFKTATRYKSDSLPQWNEKEVAVAKVIIFALLFLAMERCRDVEQLITDAISYEFKPEE